MGPTGPAPGAAHDPYAVARRRMVEEQLAARGIRDVRVLEAMAFVPRHRFVEPGLEERAYGDFALPSAEGQTISQPWIVARMLELAELEPGQRVLEIGTGTGYQTALLARLVERVFSIERLASLVRAAQRRLVAMAVSNVALRHADGTLGWQEFAPYARVLAAAAAPHVPDALLAQLGDGGVLVMPVGHAQLQRLERWRRRGSHFVRERHEDCRFVPLIGRDAWPEDPQHS
jgi:protein-L-isoaspartate(D-aspartate) O-methyltransferase